MAIAREGARRQPEAGKRASGRRRTTIAGDLQRRLEDSSHDTEVRLSAPAMAPAVSTRTSFGTHSKAMRGSAAGQAEGVERLGGGRSARQSLLPAARASPAEPWARTVPPHFGPPPFTARMADRRSRQSLLYFGARPAIAAAPTVPKRQPASSGEPIAKTPATPAPCAPPRPARSPGPSQGAESYWVCSPDPEAKGEGLSDAPCQRPARFDRAGAIARTGCRPPTRNHRPAAPRHEPAASPT